MKGKDKRERRKYVIEKRVERRMEEKSKKELLEIIKDASLVEVNLVAWRGRRH